MLPPDPRILQDEAKPERIHWVAWVVVAVGLALLIFFAVVPGVRLKMHDSSFGQIRQGATKDAVVRLMGEPEANAEALPGLERYWGDEVNPAVQREDITSVLQWRIRFLTGSVTWQVGLNADGRAVAKHRFE